MIYVTIKDAGRVLSFAFLSLSRVIHHFVGLTFSLASLFSKSSSLKSSVFNVYLTRGIGIMLQLNAKDG